MKTLYFLLLLLMSATAAADWVKVIRPTGATPERFIDTETMRQTGPMNTMRRVWELSNLNQSPGAKFLSVKSLVEYDCKDRRVRVLEENYFAGPGAQGESVVGPEGDLKRSAWRGIRKRTVDETIFKRVCPHDGP